MHTKKTRVSNGGATLRYTRVERCFLVVLSLLSLRSFFVVPFWFFFSTHNVASTSREHHLLTKQFGSFVSPPILLLSPLRTSHHLFLFTIHGKRNVTGGGSGITVLLLSGTEVDRAFCTRCVAVSKTSSFMLQNGMPRARSKI